VQRTLDVQRSHPLSLAFSADGKRIAIGLTGEVQVWTTEPAEMLASIRLPGVPFTRTALSSDGSVLAASGHQSGTVWRWKIPARAGLGPFELPPLQAGSQVRSLAFSPTGRLAVVGHEGQAGVWPPVE
jgi:WD40 repeat protein